MRNILRWRIANGNYFLLYQGLSDGTLRVASAHTQRGVRNRRHSREKGRTWSEGEIEKRKREIEKKPSDCEELQPRIATIATIVTKGKIEKRNCKGKGVQVCRWWKPNYVPFKWREKTTTFQKLVGVKTKPWKPVPRCNPHEPRNASLRCAFHKVTRVKKRRACIAHANFEWNERPLPNVLPNSQKGQDGQMQRPQPEGIPIPDPTWRDINHAHPRQRVNHSLHNARLGWWACQACDF